MKTNIDMGNNAVNHIEHASKHLKSRWFEGDIVSAKKFLEEIKERTAIIEAEIKRQLYVNLGRDKGVSK